MTTDRDSESPSKPTSEIENAENALYSYGSEFHYLAHQWLKDFAREQLPQYPFAFANIVVATGTGVLLIVTAAAVKADGLAGVFGWDAVFNWTAFIMLACLGMVCTGVLLVLPRTVVGKNAEAARKKTEALMSELLPRLRVAAIHTVIAYQKQKRDTGAMIDLVCQLDLQPYSVERIVKAWVAALHLLHSQWINASSDDITAQQLEPRNQSGKIRKLPLCCTQAWAAMKDARKSNPGLDGSSLDEVHAYLLKTGSESPIPESVETFKTYIRKAQRFWSETEFQKNSE